MAIVNLKNISKSFIDKKILNNINFIINANQKIGIVGANGCGKSTLLKIINGDIYADHGQVIKSNKYKISYLAQNSQLNSDNTLFDEMLETFSDLMEMEKLMHQLELDISQNPDDAQLLKKYAQLQEDFISLNGYSYKSQIRGVLNGLGFKKQDYQRSISTLSGGQKSRAYMAKILLEKPDVLLLDEPTNHLDLEAIEWLESFLSSYNGSIVIVSHDRYFLDSLVDTIYEIENTKITKYNGNYTQYLTQKQISDAQKVKQYNNYQAELKRQNQIIQRYKTFNTQRSIKAARSRQKAIEKMDAVDKPSSLQYQIKLSIPMHKSSGKQVISLKDLSKGFGKSILFDCVNLDIYRGQKIGFIGKNGTGKTTLFKIILNQCIPSSGKCIIGHNVEIGYYDQEQKNLDDKKSIIDDIWDCYPHMKEVEIRNWLAAFLFKNEDVFKLISTLSGGEKSRLSLLKTILSGANLLLLDEPTNHLDIQSKQALEQALIEYNGTVIVISHDRYFLDRISNRIFELENKKIKDYNGNYSYYKRKKSEIMLNNNTKVVKSQPEIKTRHKQKNNYNLYKINNLEHEIEQMENKIKQHELKMCDPSYYSDAEKSKQINIQYNHLKAQLEDLYNQWEKMLSQDK